MFREIGMNMCHIESDTQAVLCVRRSAVSNEESLSAKIIIFLGAMF
jgi:hypothetical protein